MVRLRIGMLLALATLLLAQPALGAERAGRARSVPASYQGRTIDLAQDWEGAQACMVRSSTDIRCADSAAELEDGAAVAPVAAGSSTAQASACSSSYVRLYEHINFGGRLVMVGSTSGWFNLTWIGFNDAVSSWWNPTPCTAALAQDIWGGGTIYYMQGYSSSSWIGWFNDEASAVYVQQ